MNDDIFNARLQAIESAFRHLAEIRLELEQAGIWKPSYHNKRNSNFHNLFLEISNRLAQIYLDREGSHE